MYKSIRLYLVTYYSKVTRRKILNLQIGEERKGGRRVGDVNRKLPLLVHPFVPLHHFHSSTQIYILGRMEAMQKTHTHGSKWSTNEQLVWSSRSITQHHATPRNTTQQYTALLSITQYHAAPRSITQPRTAPRSTTQYHAAPRSITQHHVCHSFYLSSLLSFLFIGLLTRHICLRPSKE